MGLAVQVLPLGHPLRIAEEAATVDQLSEGRFDFGIGRSGSPRAYDILGIPYGESQARFEECLQIILKAWKGERFSYHGQYYHFDNVLVGPRPYQLPHPPLRMASNSKETFPVVARLGLPLFVGLRDLDIPELRLRIADYRAAWREAGHPGDGDVCLRIPIYAAPRLEQLTQLSYESILETRVAVGTAPALVERLGALREELGLTGLVAELNPGGLMPLERMQRTLRILTHEVIPAFR